MATFPQNTSLGTQDKTPSSWRNTCFESFGAFLPPTLFGLDIRPFGHLNPGSGDQKGMVTIFPLLTLGQFSHSQALVQ